MSLDVSPAGDLWRKTLSRIPSLFGRLFYLSKLRNPNSGKYEHFGFAQRFSDREANRTLERSHHETFEDWLCFSVEQQYADLEAYLAELDQDLITVVKNWNAMPPFASLVPASASEAQRQLFLSDAALLLELLSSSARNHAQAS